MLSLVQKKEKESMSHYGNPTKPVRVPQNKSLHNIFVHNAEELVRNDYYQSGFGRLESPRETWDTVNPR